MADLLAEFDTAHCGTIHDTQLDPYGQCLATASADGHVRLWDVRKPEQSVFIADLGGHAGAVYQVAWAPPEAGVLLASASADGTVFVWGRVHGQSGTWHVVHRERLEQHGAVRAVAWAPSDHGVALACACMDGTVTIASHVGLLGEDGTHRWESQTYDAHKGEVYAVSWASAPTVSEERPLGLSGARLATAGEDGVRVWCRDETIGRWCPEHVESSSSKSKGSVRDVAWKPWDGVAEVLASVVGSTVVIWNCEDSNNADAMSDSRQPTVGRHRWRSVQRIDLGDEVWKISWADVGSVLLASCGTDERNAVLLKQRLSGEWDLMDVEVG